MDLIVNETTTSGNKTASTSSFMGSIDADTPSLSSLVPIWSKVCLIVFMTLAFILGVPGNSLVMVILLKLKRKTSTDWFVIFIALLDVVSLLVSCPAQIIIILPGLWTILASTALCQFHAYTTNFVFLQSSFLIACVGIDRYFKTCKPYKILLTAQSAMRCSLVLGLLSALFNVSNLFITTLNSQGDCTLDESQNTLSLVTYGILLSLVFGSCAVMCILYSKIAIQIRRRVKVSPLPSSGTGMRENKCERGHLKQRRKLDSTNMYLKQLRPDKSVVSGQFRQNENLPSCSMSLNNGKEHIDEKQQVSNLIKRRIIVREQFQRMQNQMSRKSKQVNKTTKIMAAITVVFIISAFIPVIAVAVLTASGPEDFSEFWRVVIFFMMRLYFINNFVNPIFYIWLSSAFRKNVVEAITACKRRVITYD